MISSFIFIDCSNHRILNQLFVLSQITPDGTLEIENAQLDDSAHYRCSATNYLGRASSAARVRVNLAEEEGRPIIHSFRIILIFEVGNSIRHFMLK